MCAFRTVILNPMRCNFSISEGAQVSVGTEVDPRLDHPSLKVCKGMELAVHLLVGISHVNLKVSDHSEVSSHLNPCSLS